MAGRKAKEAEIIRKYALAMGMSFEEAKEGMQSVVDTLIEASRTSQAALYQFAVACSKITTNPHGKRPLGCRKAREQPWA